MSILPILTQCGLRNIYKNYNLPIRPSVLHEHFDRRALGETQSVLPYNKAESLFFNYFGLAQSFTQLCNLSTNKIRLSDLLQRSNARCRNLPIGGPQITLCGKIAITVAQECYGKGAQELLTCSLDCDNRKDDDHGDPNVPPVDRWTLVCSD